jgi:hypothetical protein
VRGGWTWYSIMSGDRLAINGFVLLISLDTTELICVRCSGTVLVKNYFLSKLRTSADVNS